MKPRPWTKQEEDYLRLHRAHKSNAAIGAALGRTGKAVNSRSKLLKLARYPRLTKKEIAFLRRNASTMTRIELAKALGRDVKTIYNTVKRYSPESVKSQRPFTAACLKHLRKLHAKGYSDSEMGEAMNRNRKDIEFHRRRMGLPNNALSDRRRRRVARKTREQLRAAGVASLAEVRAKAFRDRARAAGWPEDLRPRAVQILNALWDRGPMTRTEIAEAIGMPWKGVRASLKSNDPEGSYLAHLVKRGLVVCLKRAVKGTGRGCSLSVYTLPATIERKAV